MIDNTIQDIRKQCRMAMNGVASTSMRTKGLNYKLNFGVSLQKIKEIASRYTPDESLATSLWIQDVRELKILATLLYPLALYTEDIANEWVIQIPNQEIREQICLHLFQNLPFADVLISNWSKQDDISVRATAYCLLARVLLTKKMRRELNLDEFPYLLNDLIHNDVSLHKAALLAIKHLGRSSATMGYDILNNLLIFKDSDNLYEQEIYNSVRFELEFYQDKRNEQ